MHSDLLVAIGYWALLLNNSNSIHGSFIQYASFPHCNMPHGSFILHNMPHCLLTFFFNYSYKTIYFPKDLFFIDLFPFFFFFGARSHCSYDLRNRKLRSQRASLFIDLKRKRLLQINNILRKFVPRNVSFDVFEGLIN